MGAVFAVSHLYQIVSDFFAAEYAAAALPVDPVVQVFGWREPTRQKLATHRIVWVPGDPTGTLGALGAARWPGSLPPARVASLRERFTVYIGAVRANDPENEIAQYEETRALFDAWFRACDKLAKGIFAVESATWTVAPKERRYGQQLVVSAWIDAAILDVRYPDASTNATVLEDACATGTAAVLDVTDPVSTCE